MYQKDAIDVDADKLNAVMRRTIERDIRPLPILLKKSFCGAHAHFLKAADATLLGAGDHVNLRKIAPRSF
jgi:hypothetical protein